MHILLFYSRWGREYDSERAPHQRNRDFWEEATFHTWVAFCKLKFLLLFCYRILVLNVCPCQKYTLNDYISWFFWVQLPAEKVKVYLLQIIFPILWLSFKTVVKSIQVNLFIELRWIWLYVLMIIEERTLVSWFLGWRIHFSISDFNFKKMFVMGLVFLLILHIANHWHYHQH